MGISAECHSDDRIYEVSFDATPWFEQATDEEIIELAYCGWGGDYAADIVATDLPGDNKELAALFSYLAVIASIPHKRDEKGFEVHVNETEAMVWLDVHRPHLSEKFRQWEYSGPQEDTLENCIASGRHLTSCDRDGYCNYCGHQESEEQE